ncbi:carbonic anhydrase [Telmatospirillum sp.]|uniref:carbonic anhydrase n=1 Tax=Telmatospirillum sp. TaxID=2079197 RepID=UPI00283D365F|nr:carbonic anhydrase [Telmatospirillum sp.]MDR3440886.1 carbonic anhydrase [Telmatospirillum sp.]
MHRLIEGYRQFRETYYPENREMFGQLAQGQSPKTMVICCCDSRVDPTLIFNAHPGEIFTLRNIANLVPPFSPDGNHHSTSAAIEFAVCSLAVEHVVIMGHAQCGGVRALLGAHEGEFIGPWMRIAEPARDAALAKVGDADPELLQRTCEQEVLKISLANLSQFAWVRKRVEAGQLALHACYFDIEKGELLVLQPESGTFDSLE